MSFYQSLVNELEKLAGVPRAMWHSQHPYATSRDMANSAGHTIAKRLAGGGEPKNRLGLIKSLRTVANKHRMTARDWAQNSVQSSSGGSYNAGPRRTEHTPISLDQRITNRKPGSFNIRQLQ